MTENHAEKRSGIEHHLKYSFIQLFLALLIVRTLHAVLIIEHKNLEQNGWVPEKIEETCSETSNTCDGPMTTVQFKNGSKQGYYLYKMKFIGQLDSGLKMPYLIFSGRDCIECDANAYLYINLPDKDITKFSYPYPGKLFSYENNSLISQTRAFYGHCLPTNEAGIIWYYTVYENGKPHDYGMKISVDKNGKMPKRWTKSALPQLQETLSHLDANRCQEIKGIDQTSEP